MYYAHYINLNYKIKFGFEKATLKFRYGWQFSKRIVYGVPGITVVQRKREPYVGDSIIKM